MWTLPRNTVCAIAPPISAAAMLSRKEDSTNTMTSSTKAPFHSRGRIFRQHRRHLAVLEMLRQQRETEQQAQQVGEDDPFVLQVLDETRDAGARLEPGECELVEGDGRQPDQRHPQRVMVEQRHAEQRQRKQDEIDRNPEDGRRLARRRGERQGAASHDAPATAPRTSRPDRRTRPPLLSWCMRFSALCVCRDRMPGFGGASDAPSRKAPRAPSVLPRPFPTRQNCGGGAVASRKGSRAATLSPDLARHPQHVAAHDQRRFVAGHARALQRRREHLPRFDRACRSSAKRRDRSRRSSATSRSRRNSRAACRRARPGGS